MLKYCTIGLSSLLLITGNHSIESEHDLEWQNWKVKQNVVFSTNEEEFRYNTFRENRKFVLEHNNRFNLGLETYTVGLNKFAAMNESEVALKYKTLNKNLGITLKYKCPTTFRSNGAAVPTLISYWKGQTCEADNESSCVDTKIQATVVKDQGNCGSCWAFGATMAIEASLCRENRYDCTSWNGISAQEMVSCASRNSDLDPYDNFGCQGGFQSNALKYVEYNNYKMMSWDDYGYRSGKTSVKGDCDYQQTKAISNVLSSCGMTPVGDEQALAQAVSEIGAFSISIDASGVGYTLYESGIYTNSRCKNKNNQLDHAVGVTGYGLYPFPGGNPYWEVKNSWGTDWGMNGYMLMEKDNDNACGVATDTAYAIV